MMIRIDTVYMIKGKPVLITDGKYHGANGLVSNFWYGNYVGKNGNVLEKGWCGYGNEVGIKKAKKHKIVKKILWLKEKESIGHTEYCENPKCRGGCKKKTNKKEVK